VLLFIAFIDTARVVERASVCLSHRSTAGGAALSTNIAAALAHMQQMQAVSY